MKTTTALSDVPSTLSSFDYTRIKEIEGQTIPFPHSPTGYLELCNVLEDFTDCKWGHPPKGSNIQYTRTRGGVPNSLIYLYL